LTRLPGRVRGRTANSVIDMAVIDMAPMALAPTDLLWVALR
jgi:hypothetical protein